MSNQNIKISEDKKSNKSDSINQRPELPNVVNSVAKELPDGVYRTKHK